jgi:hypothetical protein
VQQIVVQVRNDFHQLHFLHVLPTVPKAGHQAVMSASGDAALRAMQHKRSRDSEDRCVDYRH